MKIDLFDYKFDAEKIAKYPKTNRDEANLMAVDVKNFKITHKKFYEITDFIEKGDAVVVNNSGVKKARIFGKRGSGGKVEIFITEFPADISFPLKLKSLVKAHKTIKENEKIEIAEKIYITAEKNFGGGLYQISIETKSDYDYIFEKCAAIPLPPYIKRPADEKDDIYYQTVYADDSAGLSVAAPTAGLHFTEKIINSIKEKGGIFTNVSLNIGLGTFLPVRTEDRRKHEIHKETYTVTKETADIVNGAIKSGNKIIITGTSAVRSLESAAVENKDGACFINPVKNEETSLYIYPGYKFKATKNLITNFHQPKSSLYIMICALIGIDKTKAVYEEALRKDYSLFSYGDAMYLYNI